MSVHLDDASSTDLRGLTTVRTRSRGFREKKTLTGDRRDSEPRGDMGFGSKSQKGLQGKEHQGLLFVC